MAPSSPSLPSRASLARLLAAAQRAHNPQHISLTQLQRFVTHWFPQELWESIYATSNAGRESASGARKPSPFQRFCKNPRRVSPEWTAALQLVALSRQVQAPAGGCTSRSPSDTQRSSAPLANLTQQTVEHILRFGVFPPAGWAVTLGLLHVWRQEQQQALAVPAHVSSSSSGDSTRPLASPPVSGQLAEAAFPAALPPPAAAQLLHHLSLAPPSSERWQDALRLYQQCAAQAYAPGVHRGTGGPPASLSEAASPFLKALRHVALTTLLQAGEWERGLHFYYHSLYQRDLPGTVTTGYLVQALGEAGQWAAVLRVYELCVQLLIAQRQRRGKGLRDGNAAPSRPWGTTLSMAMAAVQRSPAAPPTALAAMVRQLCPSEGPGDANAATAPLVQLDGNFLAAVQALPTEDDRVAVLRLAKRERLLDTFKLIRGLLSKHRWEEALMVFREAMKTTVTPAALNSGRAGRTAAGTQPATAREREDGRSVARLSRREIGEVRLNFLHCATLHNVEKVVALLNEHHNERQCRGGAMVADRWALNDQEVECVLSKTLEADEATVAQSRCASDFWQYCLGLLERNYGTQRTGVSSPLASVGNGSAAAGDASQRGGAASLRCLPRPHRRPTAAALSFLLRHPRLPWRIALQLLVRHDLLDVPGAREPAHELRDETRSTARGREGGRPGPHQALATTRVLALNAAAERLASQGQRGAAEAVALRALDAEVSARGHSQRGVSLSASLLRLASLPVLLQLLLAKRRDELYVDGRVLFHLLRESARAGEEGDEEMKQHTGSTGGLFDGHGSEFFADHPCGRALTVVHLLMQRNALSRSSSPCCSVSEAAQTVQTLPASLFLLGTRLPGSTAAPRSASESVPPVPWLLAYPPSVHCEVVRVLRCVTAAPLSRLCWKGTGPGNSHLSPETEAGVRYTQRWTWTMRYLRALADFFAQQPCHTPASTQASPPLAFASAGQPTTAQKAEEAYYVSTFETVLSLLDTVAVPESLPSVGLADSAHSGAEETVRGDVRDGERAAPCTSQQRVQLLSQLLERAIARYGCAPPTHMFLPNQLDRLLPPLVRRGGASTEGAEAAEAVCERKRDLTRQSIQERCAVAACLVELTLRSLNATAPEMDVDGDVVALPRAVEPALLHNAVKLCCRVAERLRALPSLPREVTGVATVDGAKLCQVGAALVRLQAERCGPATVQPGTLSLLYHLCAAAQSSLPEGGCSQPRRVALETTAYLLRQQASSGVSASHEVPWRGNDVSSSPARGFSAGHMALQPSSGVSRSRRGRGKGHRTSAAVVQPRHCDLFFSLFGWEDALDVWYPTFPRDVLRLLAGDPRAIEACLSLEEGTEK